MLLVQRLLKEAERLRRDVVRLRADLFERLAPLLLQLVVAERGIEDAVGDELEPALPMARQHLGAHAERVAPTEAADGPGHRLDLVRQLVAGLGARAAGDERGDEVVDAVGARVLVAQAAHPDRAHRHQPHRRVALDEQPRARRQLDAQDLLVARWPAPAPAAPSAPRPRSRRSPRRPSAPPRACAGRPPSCRARARRWSRCRRGGTSAPPPSASPASPRAPAGCTRPPSRRRRRPSRRSRACAPAPAPSPSDRWRPTR